MKDCKNWPTDYQDWSGSFDELVETARSIQEQEAPQAKLLNPRLVRHYQSVGAVGRGVREGRASRFGFADLAALMATKGLVEEGWTLSNAAPLANSVPAPALATLTTNYGSSRSEGEVPNDTAASRLVRELMGQSPSASPVPVSMGSSRLLRSAAPRFTGASATLASHFAAHTAAATPTLNFATAHTALPTGCTDAIAPWLTLEFDAGAAAAATPEERQAASQALSAWSKRHLG